MSKLWFIVRKGTQVRVHYPDGRTVTAALPRDYRTTRPYRRSYSNGDLVFEDRRGVKLVVFSDDVIRFRAPRDPYEQADADHVLHRVKVWIDRYAEANFGKQVSL